MDTFQVDTLLPHVIPACGSRPNHRTKEKIMVDVPANFATGYPAQACDAVTAPTMLSRHLEAECV
jgi:hypothetical protein